MKKIDLSFLKKTNLISDEELIGFGAKSTGNDCLDDCIETGDCSAGICNCQCVGNHCDNCLGEE